MVNKVERSIKKTTRALAAPTLSTAGTLFLGPLGGILGAITGDVFQRLLSEKEKSRMQMLIELAELRYKEKIEQGCKSKIDDNKKAIYSEIAEGTLLAASKSYEEKKVNLLANLLVTAEFTNTPIENLHQTLIHAQQLSYRQLLIISIVGKNTYGLVNLRNKDFREDLSQNHSEELLGVLSDIRYLMDLGFISQKGGLLIPLDNIIPSDLLLNYSGNLLFNGMQLSSIPLDEYRILEKLFLDKIG